MKNNRDLKQYGWLLSIFYTLMVKFSDNSYIMNEFKKRIDNSKKILELGSGPGKDYEILAKDYDIIGSDYSDTFLKMLRRKFNQGRFLKINALTMDTDKKFDVIFSNKVLHHLSPGHLAHSLERQYETLNPGGILFHTMWKGNNAESAKKTKEKSIPDIRYQQNDIDKIISDIHYKFILLEFIVYKELKKDDSFIMVMKKNL